ncbi:MAG: serpin family protein [Hydrogenophilaceae bacterium]|jgi:serpin B|nr:serpin family protein [Hydrogenophilaceae bacterium]
MRRTLAVIALAFMTACAAAQPPNTAEPTMQQAEPGDAPAAPSSGESAFDVALYRELAQESGGHFVSPLSVESAFALVYAGARGRTAAEMADVFGYDADFAAAAAAAQARDAALEANGQFAIANAVWVERSFALAPPYVRLVRDRMGAMVAPLDFSDRRSAANTINAWVSEATAERIPSLISEAFITEDARLVLTNAVYFKADWADQFRANDTREGDFRLASGDTRRAQLMRQTTRARYFEEDAFQAAEFDYAGDAFALAVFLPRTPDGLPSLEARLGDLTPWLARLSAANRAELNLTLPKVEMNTSYDLVAPLQRLGLRAAFSHNADLSGIAGGGLVVSKVIHKAFLKIDEQGTEAAAATAIGVEVTSAPAPPPRRIDFTADRPFFLVLRHKPSGQILFLGRVVDPAG